MRRICFGFAIASVAILGGSASMAPAIAAPPTVTPSPGYDARLQEQRRHILRRPSLTPWCAIPGRGPGITPGGFTRARIK